MTLPTFVAKRWRLRHSARSCRTISAADTGDQQQTRWLLSLLS